MFCLATLRTLCEKAKLATNPGIYFPTCLRGPSTQEESAFGDIIGSNTFTMFKSARDSLELLAPSSSPELVDQVMIEIEGAIALFFALRGCTTYSSMFSVMFLHVRKYLDTSATAQVMHYVSGLFDFESHDGEETNIVIEPQWLTSLKNIKDDWRGVKAGPLFSQLSKLIGLFVTIGMCEATNVTFTVAGFKVFEPDLMSQHKNAIDCVSAAFDTVIFFVERMYYCYAHGSISPIFRGDEDATKIDEEYSTITLWWDMVKNGNLEKVVGVTEHEFDNRLEKLCALFKNMLAHSKGFEKNIIHQKFTKLLGIKNDYVTMKISSGVRKAPFAIELYGPSSQGKTTFGDQIVDALLFSADLPMDKEYRCTFNPSDKYMSNWKTSMQVMYIDDMANEKAKYVEKPPTRAIIDICNNQPYYANMADIDSKGKVFVEPSIVVVSTNKIDLDAAVYSNCPYSVQRRMHYVVEVVAQSRFQRVINGRTQGIDPDKIRKHYGTDKPLFDDIWCLTIKRAVCPEELTDVAQYEVVKDGKKKLEDISYREAMQFLIRKFHEHRSEQSYILDMKMDRSSKLEKCDCSPGCVQIKGYCDACGSKKQRKKSKTFEAHDGVEFITQSYDYLLQQSHYYFSCLQALWFVPRCTYLENLLVRVRLLYLMGTNPSVVLAYFRNFVTWLFLYIVLNCVFIAGVVSIAPQYTLYFVCLSLLFCLTLAKAIFLYEYNAMCAHLCDMPVMGSLIEYVRRDSLKYLCSTFLVVGTLYVIAKSYLAFKSVDVQGSLEPETQEDVDKRDSEDNPWTQVVQRELPISDASKTSTCDRLGNNVKKNLLYGSVKVNETRTLMANGLFLKSNVVLIPSHYFEVDDLDVVFRKDNPDYAGGKFEVKLSKLASVAIPDTDFSICYSSTGGSFKDIIKYFPEGDLPPLEFEMLWRQKDGELKIFKGLTKPGMARTCVSSFKGGVYANLDGNTFAGLCGATLISKSKGATIIGLHLGGTTGTPRGCYGSLTQKQINDAIDKLSKIEGVLISGSAEHFEKQILGINVLEPGNLHRKSPLNYMPQDSQVQYFGNCKGRSKPHTDVKVTLMSEHVAMVMGAPNIYCAPKMWPDWYGWQTCLSNLSIPAKPYPHDLLCLAVLDYKSDMLKLYRSELWNNASPLNDGDNLCGIVGKKFMDAIKLGTSIGYPLSGEKRRFVLTLPPTEERPNNLQFTDDIMSEIKRCEDCYKLGNRAYTIAKACKKDEVLTKEKCRIFYGNPIALTWLVRKYFLPILRVMQMNPLVSECAVGINSHGPEWNDLHNYVFFHGSDRLIGGDYGKYDQKIPSQLLLASLRIMIDFARECNYTEEDIRVMEAMSGDLVYALIAFNGDLIGLTSGTHISGNSLTVILNGICGSLNLRAYFYATNRPVDFGQRIPFRSVVNIMTYGDDNIGSVSKSIDNFTIRGISEFLAAYGQEYTMPDKHSDLLDFLPEEQFEFLKRKSVFCPDKGVYVGALVDKSIYKMLHMYMRPKGAILSEEQACAQNVDTALREWANHGRNVYETQRSLLREVAKLSNLSHLCTRLDVDYDMCVEEWRERYDESYVKYEQCELDFMLDSTLE